MGKSRSYSSAAQETARNRTSIGAEPVVAVLVISWLVFGVITLISTENITNENYQQIFSEAGFSTPRSIDEAALWTRVAERQIWTNYPVLLDYRPGETIRQPRSSEYGWYLVAQTTCKKDTASATVEYWVDGVLKETLEIPLLKGERFWEGSVATKSTTFKALCNPEEPSEFVAIRLVPN